MTLAHVHTPDDNPLSLRLTTRSYEELGGCERIAAWVSGARRKRNDLLSAVRRL